MPPKPAPAASSLDESIAELQALYPDPEIVTQDSVSVSIPVMDSGQFARVLMLVVPAFKGADPDSTIEVLLASNAELALNVLAIGIRQPISYINAMPADLSVKCMATLVQKNADFFRERVLPMLPGLLAASVAPGPAP